MTVIRSKAPILASTPIHSSSPNPRLKISVGGPQGPQGPVGAGVSIKGSVANITDLPVVASIGDAYIVTANGHLYVWNSRCTR